MKYNFGGLKLHEELYDEFINDPNYRILDDGTIWNISDYIDNPNYTIDENNVIWLKGFEDPRFHVPFFPAVNFERRYLATKGHRSPRTRMVRVLNPKYKYIDLLEVTGSDSWFYVDGDVVYCSDIETFRSFKQWDYFCPDELYLGASFPGNFKRIWRLDSETLSYNLMGTYENGSLDSNVIYGVWKLSGQSQSIDTFESEYPPNDNIWPRSSKPPYPNPLEFPYIPEFRSKYLVVPYKGYYLKAHRIVYRKFRGQFNSIFDEYEYTHHIIPDPPPFVPFPIIHLNGDTWDNRPENLVECFYHPAMRRRLWGAGHYFWPDSDKFTEFDNQGKLVIPGDEQFDGEPHLNFYELTDEIIEWIETTTRTSHPRLYPGEYNFTIRITVCHDKRTNFEYPFNYDLSNRCIEWRYLGLTWADLGTYTSMSFNGLGLIDSFFNFIETHPEYQSAFNDLFL